MSEKPYSFALLVGRFQMLHRGHEEMIRTALASADRVGILIGSSEESGTFYNPFSYELRTELIRKVFGDALLLAPLKDIHVGNVSKWGDYVIETARTAFQVKPDLFVTGKEARRESWFEGEAGKGLSELIVPKTVEISASELRSLFLSGNVSEWKRYTNPVLWDEFSRLKELVEASEAHRTTGSI